MSRLSNSLRKLAIALSTKFRASRKKATFGYDGYVSRPMINSLQSGQFNWKDESILILGSEKGLFDLSHKLANHNASVSFCNLVKFQDIYQIRVEDFTIVIMGDSISTLEFDVLDVGGTLRRADSALILVWASPNFVLSEISDYVTSDFCDILLSLPSSPEKLEALLKERG